MTLSKLKQEGWEKEFNNKFGVDEQTNLRGKDVIKYYKEVVEFIRKQRKELLKGNK